MNLIEKYRWYLIENLWPRMESGAINFQYSIWADPKFNVFWECITMVKGEIRS